MSDYKRRVSSTATVEACYYSAPQGYCGISFGLEFEGDKSDILGLATGGQMYGSFDLTLLIVSFIP